MSRTMEYVHKISTVIYTLLIILLMVTNDVLKIGVMLILYSYSTMS